MRIIRNESKNFKTAYVLINGNNTVITEGTCLEVLFEILRMREQMLPLERIQINLMIYETYGFYPDTIEQQPKEQIQPTHSQAKVGLPAA